jgi:hypothetical protein
MLDTLVDHVDGAINGVEDGVDIVAEDGVDIVAEEFANEVDEFANGVDEFANGVDEFANGVDEFANGVDEFTKEGLGVEEEFDILNGPKKYDKLFVLNICGTFIYFCFFYVCGWICLLVVF